MWVVVLSALRNGVTPRRIEQIQEHLDVSERTLGRWRRWWREEFAQSGFWKAMRGLFGRPVDPGHLPASLLERFEGDGRSRLLSGLCLLLPVTGGKGLTGHDLRWVPKARKRCPGSCG
jgi:hypothetical protein